MERKKAIPLLLVMLLLFPIHAAAVEFEIPAVTIEAELNEDGSVDVSETHTYEFDGEFNGITRTIIPKQDTSIVEFVAYEDSRPLKVEHEEGSYKIYRGGEDETVTVDLRYRIVDGVEKFEDGAEFYWPFFDERNESDYGDMTVTVRPPAPDAAPLFLGYDAAYGTGRAEGDGTVTFEMGSVSEGENGDIRVIYDPALFPAAAESAGTVRQDLLNDQERQAEEAALFAANQDRVSGAGTIAVPAAGAVILALLGQVYFRTRRQKRDTQAALSASTAVVPPERMSIPATLYFVKSMFLTPNVTAAALLDLVRKGKAEQMSEEEFCLLDRQSTSPHEAVLIRLLFNEIGDGSRFNLKDLEAYTKNSENHASYTQALSDWNRLVGEEVKSNGLYERKTGFRWFLALFGAGLAALAAVFGWYELYVLLSLAIALALGAWAFAAFYHPLTSKGRLIRAEWKQFEEQMDELTEQDWAQLTRDERLRAFAYGTGITEGTSGKQAKRFAQVQKQLSPADPSMLYANPVLLTAMFTSASTNASASTTGSSAGTSAGGGGVGGGGGGSGAF